jgi:hypothetical protein
MSNHGHAKLILNLAVALIQFPTKERILPCTIPAVRRDQNSIAWELAKLVDFFGASI